jgi:Carboxypeptidase regulatory-like domain/Bacterial Ig-like domain (group 2)
MRAHLSLRAAAGLLALAGAAACADFLAAPADAPARLSVSYALAPGASAAQSGAGRAFDRVDHVHLHVWRGETRVLADTFDVTPADSGVIRHTLTLELERGEEELRVDVELHAHGHAVFSGGQSVRLSRGASATAEVALLPVPAAVSIAPGGTFRSLGDTVPATAVVTFATGDTVPAPAVVWSGPDAAVLQVLADGRMVARAEGQGRVVAVSGDARAEATVTVRAIVAAVVVSPDSAMVMRADSVRFTATARDGRGNVLARTLAWSTANAPVATVGNGGTARAVAPGQAQIRATAEGVTGNGRMRVVPRRGAATVDVQNAVNSRAVAGATVTARIGASASPTDPPSATATTSADGRARLAALDEGVYTVFVTAPGMITAVLPGVTVAPDADGHWSVVISPVLPAGETRIVLTWGADPRDLDSHLTGPNTAGGRFHVYFGNRRFMLADTAIVELDVDDTSGFGPETITVHEQFPGTYCFSVNLYTGTGSLGTSGAQVRVFRGSQQVATFAAPSTTNRVWTVFRMSGDTITPVNTTGSAVPGVCP